MSAGPLVVGAEGVILVRHKANYASSRPIDEGIAVVSALSHFPTTQATVLVDTRDEAGAEYFVKAHGLPTAAVMTTAIEDKDLDPALAQWYNVERVRSRGPVWLVITAYSFVYESCAKSSQPCLLYARRGSIGAMDSTPTWDDLHERVMRREKAIVEDM